MEFDLRYLILITVNILKSTLSVSDNWDPFHIFDHRPNYPTFMEFMNKLFFLLLFSFLFSIIRITIHHPITTIHINSGYFNKSFYILCLASLLLPQMLFWYIFFITIILSSSSSWIFNTCTSFREWIMHIFATIPRFSLFINGEFDINNSVNEQGQYLETPTTPLLPSPV
ncbi:hypothetical protein RDI58_020814 [Solanum bulbocastanum]|uniref:Uncharacterized protein n=1 Tax=Solanum bulbocastanum TaxID=147425 RepID=A0AAN8T700_SOLBU